MTVFPHSPTIGDAPDVTLLEEIAEEALDAFFKVVGIRLDELYPGTHTSGDVDPREMASRSFIALAWVNSHALNNAAVSAATDQEESSW